jgi:hypothetical protein
LVDFKTEQIKEEHQSENKREETCPFHDLKVSGRMRTILQNVLEIYFIGCETVHIPSHTPKI